MTSGALAAGIGYAGEVVFVRKQLTSIEGLRARKSLRPGTGL